MPAFGSLPDPVAWPGSVIGPPVFVLCGARSGSTLLRFILDAHPDLACPPETNIPALCAELATVWSLIEGAPLSPERGVVPPVIPDSAITGIRHTVDFMIGSYLARRGRKRFCDKSLGTARFTDLLLRVYPGARFLCLYRHPMDMIASGIEAGPWGLRGYGFDPYIAASPGSTVLALARYWSDNAIAILTAEEQFPGACHRIRYEDLVTDPEETAAEIFGFLGVPQMPEITTRCFNGVSERSGPADYKIWYTSRISQDSVGRGWTLPVAEIPDSVRRQVNEIAGRLGYIQVDDQWGTATAPGDLRTGGPAARDEEPGPAEPEATRLSRRIGAGLARLNGEFARRWGLLATEPFGIVITGAAGTGQPARWRFDLAAGTATRLTGDDDETEWDVLGSTTAWESVLDGEVNLGVALRRYELRYSDTGDDAEPFAAHSRVDMLCDFLGLATRPAGTEIQPATRGENHDG